jgi:hypothetical protein
MNTERLIDILAKGAEAVPPRAVERQMSLTVVLGGAGAALLMLAVFGLNPKLSSFLSVGGFWIKVVFTAALSIEALGLTLHLARPGDAVGRSVWWIAAVIAVLWVIAGVTLIDADAGSRAATVMGRTWRTCPFNIALLSAPIFVATALALRNLAPTRLRAAGAAAGFFAGAFGAFAYCFHCPEMAPPFIGTWYVAGIAIPTLVGAALGPRVLRW